MSTSNENEKIELFRKEDVSLKSDFRKKQSLVFKISFLYLSLTLFNLLIFWIALGSNQMGLIKDKAVLSTRAKSYEIIHHLRSIIDDKNWHNRIKHPRYKKSAINELKISLRRVKNSKKMIIPGFKLISIPNGKIIYEYSASKKEKFKKIAGDKKELRYSIKSWDLKDKFGKLFLGIPDVSDYKIQIYIPITNEGVDDLILACTIPMKTIKNELRSLIILAIAMLCIMIFVQTIFGYIIYRILIYPVKKLSAAAQKISDGDLNVFVKAGDKNEMDNLIYVFNNMAASLKEKTEKLEGTIKELEHHNKIVQNELDMAQVIQQSLMPVKSVSDRIDMSVYYSPLEKVSGDYYDMFELKDGSIGLLITDASGHGIPAALVTMMAKVHFTGNAQNFNMPGDLLEKVNSELSRDVTTSDYLTAFYMVVRPDLTIHYCNASHQLCMIYKKKTGKIEQLNSQGFFIGAMEESPFPYETAETKLEPEDRIILFTDGIIEATNPKNEEYTIERFIERIKEYAHLPLDDFNKKIIEDVDAFSDGQPRTDDYSLYTIQIVSQNPEIENMMNDAVEFLKARSFKKAEALFNKVLDLEPFNTRAKLSIANCHFFQDKYKEAIEIFEKYIEGNPTNSSVMLKLSISYEKIGQDDKAIELYNKTLKLNDKLPAVYTQLGILYAKKGKKKKSIDLLDKAIELRPSDSRIKKIKEKIVNE